MKKEGQFKICSRCKIQKTLDCYYVKTTTFDGYDHYCKECHKISVKQYQEKNRDKIREKSLEYQMNNQEKIQKRQKEYREKNLSSLQEKSREYYYKNRDRILKEIKEKKQIKKEQQNNN